MSNSFSSVTLSTPDSSEGGNSGSSNTAAGPNTYVPINQATTVCVGIGGGVGPAAGVALHRHIIEQTKSDGTDQSHLEVHHISRPDVADRTSYLLGKGDRNPGEDMAITMAALAESSLAAGKTSVVAGVPCNTFHAPPIWNAFMAKMRENGTDKVVHMVHMLEETSASIEMIQPGTKRVGLLSTTGTRRSRVYHNLLEPKGYTVIEVDSDRQDAVHDAIYNPQWGLKAVQPTTEKARAAFIGFASELVKKGAQVIILGCTEIPLALTGHFFKDVRLIDPMEVLARALVRRAGALTANIALPSIGKTGSFSFIQNRYRSIWGSHLRCQGLLVGGSMLLQLLFRLYGVLIETAKDYMHDPKISTVEQSLLCARQAASVPKSSHQLCARA